MELKTVMRPGILNVGLTELAYDIKRHFDGKPITLIEIGSYMGESAEIFARCIPNSRIICIDPWEGGFDNTDPCSNDNYSEVEKAFDLRTKNYPNIEKLKGYSTGFKIECDVVYIDGRHFYDGVKEDILHWMPYIKSGGIISGHDYYLEESGMYKTNPHIQGVKKAVDEILQSIDKNYIDASWIKRL